MAWKIYIQDLPAVGSVAEIPPAFMPGPIGAREALLHRLIAAVPLAERQDDDWLFVRTPVIDISLQLVMEDADQVRCIVVQVHGGEESVACVDALVKATGLRALDTRTGEFFRPDPS